MVKINWSEVEATKDQLLRSGATDSFEMMIIVFYHSKHDCDRVQVRLANLEQALFDIVANSDVKGVFLYDAAMKKPYYKAQEADRVSELETAPVSGHPSVLAEFDKMTPEARDVWLEISMSQQAHHVQGVTVT